MSDSAEPTTFTSFDGTQRIASGPKADVAIAVRRASDAGAAGPLWIFDDATGRSIDLDLRGTDAQIRKRYASLAAAPSSDNESLPGSGGDSATTTEPRGRGRPKLGVVAREVTLLPRHWDWLATQTGGASVALRKLVDEARREHAARDGLRQAQQRAYHFMSAIAGDYPGFEEASRALFAGNMTGLQEIVDAWPEDIRAHLFLLAQI